MILIDIFNLFVQSDICHYLFYSFSYCGVSLLVQQLVFGRAKL